MQDVIETTVPRLVLVPKTNQRYYHVITGYGTPIAWCSCETDKWRCPVIYQWIEENSSERIPG